MPFDTWGQPTTLEWQGRALIRVAVSNFMYTPEDIQDFKAGLDGCLQDIGCLKDNG